MGPRHLKVGLIVLIAAASAACGTGAPSQPPSPTPMPRATTFEEYAVSFCAAWTALFTAVGNPDTGSGSVLSLALDRAAAAQDEMVARQKAAEITAELESGRRHAAAAGGWAPAAPMLAELDRVFVAFEAMTAAKVAVARGDPNAIEPQAALEGAGGIEAWFAGIAAYGAMYPDGPTSEQCVGVPIAP